MLKKLKFMLKSNMEMKVKLKTKSGNMELVENTYR